MKMAIIASLALTVNVNSQTTLTVSEDTHVQSGNEIATNYGSATLNRVKTGTGSATRITWLKFDLSGYSNISAATINFPNVKNIDPAFTVTLSKGPNNWTEGNLTWNNSPSKGALITTFDMPTADTSIDITNIVVTAYTLEQFAADKMITFVLSNEAATPNSGQMRIPSKEDGMLLAPYLSITGTVLGIEDQNIEGFTAYPNPVNSANGYCMDMFAPSGIDNIKVFSLLGQKIKSIENINSNNYSLDFSDINGRGVYLVEIQDGNNSKTIKKVLKN